MAEKFDLAEHLEVLVRRLFPPESELKITSTQDGGFIISAGWRLGTHRMDNWSKDIHVRIFPEVAERYGRLNEKGRQKADANLVSFIKLKLSDFRPEHDRPRYLLPPVEVWEVKFDTLFQRPAA